MFHQSNSSNINDKFKRIDIHAKALQQLFINIQKKDLSYLKGKYPIINNDTIPNTLKSLKKLENNIINTKESYEKKLQKINHNKKKELEQLVKKMMSSNEEISKFSDEINKIVHTKKPQEDILQAHIQMETKKLNDLNIDIQVCNYLQHPQKGFNALEIVQQYEKTYMEKIYSDDLEASWIISSYFTNPSSNQEICKAVNMINKYILDFESKLKNIDSNFISDHPSSSYEDTSATVSSVSEQTESYFLVHSSMNITDESRSSLLGINYDDGHDAS